MRRTIMATYETHQGPGPQVLSASTITGDEVRNPEGDDLGKIEEVMLDMGSGRISYAVLSFGGVMGLGDKLFAIPWSALELDPDNRCFVLDVEKEKLENAPGFDKDNWPSFADNTWATQIHSYYGSRPYWEI
jgi:sporulation protein YlmC with PRC-barrel domain